MRTLLIVSSIAFLFAATFNSAEAIEGFYKDVFVDEGTDLGGPGRMPALDLVQFTHEWMEIDVNTTLQSSIMTTNSNDDNGVLVYPDGEPRFAIVYYHGGSMGHYDDLEEEGQRIVRSQYYNGGSQFGSCAGCYLLSRWYLNLWPGRMNGENVSDTRLEHTIPENSPLLNYFGFQVGDTITNVYHNNGGSVDTSDMPEGTEIVTMHITDSMSGYAAIWAWKDNDTTGQVVGITSHPEGSSADDQEKEMGGILLYLKDGLAPPDIKHELKHNEQILMNKVTADNDPLYTKIGDKQYHHFTIDLSQGAKNLNISVDADDGFDMHLFARKDSYAFIDSADHANTDAGPDKDLAIPTIASGIWYIGVKCATTVDAEEVSSGNDSYYEYSGKLEVLNGVAYSIKATWEPTGIIADNNQGILNQLAVNFNGTHVLFDVGKVHAQNLKVFDLQGRLCWQTKMSQTVQRYTWRPRSAGIYVICLETGKEKLTKRLNIVK